MSKQIMHLGNRSWWDGTLKTLCGLTIPDGGAEKVWFPSLSRHTPCPTCEAVHQRTSR
ncbi:hypothetical protein [Saccharothrix sp.]|uniref:hypothetical protein n=1 Tax=Saccharothrix sp. TaxID=1873460 RepID=UPI0028115555|nr:hypothetical protein [Saccharothrix sp.]